MKLILVLQGTIVSTTAADPVELKPVLYISILQHLVLNLSLRMVVEPPASQIALQVDGAGVFEPTCHQVRVLLQCTWVVALLFSILPHTLNSVVRVDQTRVNTTC